MLLIVLALVTLLPQAPVQPATPAGLAGRIVDATTHAGIADARVTVIPVPTGGGPPRIPVDGPPSMTITDRDGRYAFDNVPPGRYRVNVQKAGFAPADNRAGDTVTVVAGQRVSVPDVPLQRGAAIAGRILDDTGEPLAGARVTALRRMPVGQNPRAVVPPDRFLGPAGSAESNDLGEFRLFGLPPGEYVVGASTAPMMTERVMPRDVTLLPTYYPGTPDTAAAQTIVLTSGQTYGDVTIRLIAVRAFQVSGIVRDQAGAPVANALVRLESTDRVQPGVAMMMGRNQVHTDAAGRFVIANVTAGSYTVSAASPVVIARAPDRGAAGGVVEQFGLSAGIVSGPVGGGVTTETRNGVTTQWRDDATTRQPVTISDANLLGLEIVVK